MKKDLLKITQDTNLWKKGQKVWAVFWTGALAIYVIGKFRGKGKWIKGWVHIQDVNSKKGKSMRSKVDAKYIDEIEVKKEFGEYIDFLSGVKP